MTTEQKQLVAIIAAAIFLALLTCTWFWGYRKGYDVALNLPHQTDTVWRTKTRYIEKPVEVIKWKEKEKTVYVAVRDTVVRNDTTYVVLPREHKVYEDSTYKAEISGVEPRLEWIQVNQRTVTITNTIEKPTPYKWTLSAFGDVGYPLGVRAGLTFDKQAIGPLRWYVQGGYEYNPSYKGVFVQGGVKLDILKK